MRVAVSGAKGFIGQNLRVRLAERPGVEIIPLARDDDEASLTESVRSADLVIHLAGVNRPRDEQEFETGNHGFTERLCSALERAQSQAPVLYASSIQAERDNPYGRSKRQAELALERRHKVTGSAVEIFRLPNVFGKWARPDYNSVVATFCHRIARGIPIEVHDPDARLRLVHVDDVCDTLLARLRSPPLGCAYADVAPEYETTLADLAATIRGFFASRDTLMTDRVGVGLPRALYATYVSYLPPEQFAYTVPRYEDPRGAFVEMLKTPDCGQFSYFTAGPGVTRGEHYHHAKTEKFLVIAGEAQFGFRHIVTGETHVLRTTGGEGRIVESIPGWTHDITNVGHSQLIVMLWANEVFDRARPDTIAEKVGL